MDELEDIMTQWYLAVYYRLFHLDTMSFFYMVTHRELSRDPRARINGSGLGMAILDNMVGFWRNMAAGRFDGFATKSPHKSFLVGY